MVNKISKISVINVFVILWFLFVVFCWILSWFNIFSLSYIKVFTIPAFIMVISILVIKVREKLKYLKRKEFKRVEVLSLTEERKIKDIIFIVVLSLIFLFQFLVILVLPPTNWDSMTYHLPKIALALQNNSLILPADIPITRINSSPWNSEIANLAIFSVINSDLLIELPQLLAALGIILLLIGYLKIKEKWILFSLFTIPIFVTQMVTTQNDLILYFLCLFSFISLDNFYNKMSFYNLMLFLSSSALLIGTKVNAIPFLFIIVIVLTIYKLTFKIRQGILHRISKIKWSFKNILLTILFIPFFIIVAFPSYIISKEYYNNFLYQPTITASKFTIGIETIKQNIIHFSTFIIKPSQFKAEVYNHDTGHLGDIYIWIIAILSIFLIVNKLFRKNIFSEPLFIVSILTFLFFITIHYPDPWDLRLVLFPLVTILVLAINEIVKKESILSKILLGALILGLFTNFFSWIWYIGTRSDILNMKIPFTIGQYYIVDRPSIRELEKEAKFNNFSNNILIIAGEDTWVYPYFNINRQELTNKMYFITKYTNEKYDYIVLDKNQNGSNENAISIEKCYKPLGVDSYTVIYTRDENKCN